MLCSIEEYLEASECQINKISSPAKEKICVIFSCGLLHKQASKYIHTCAYRSRSHLRSSLKSSSPSLEELRPSCTSIGPDRTQNNAAEEGSGRRSTNQSDRRLAPSEERGHVTTVTVGGRRCRGQRGERGEGRDTHFHYQAWPTLYSFPHRPFLRIPTKKALRRGFDNQAGIARTKGGEGHSNPSFCHRTLFIIYSPRVTILRSRLK